MAMLVVITALASAPLDNVTTVLLIAPGHLAGVRAHGAACRAGLTFSDFVVHLAPLAVMLVVVLLALCRVMFRRSFVYDDDRAAEIMPLEEREAIRDPRLLLQGLIVLGLVVAGFVLHPVLHHRLVPR